MLAHANCVSPERDAATAPAAEPPDFLAMLPLIAAYARRCFRHLPADFRLEAVQECVAFAWQAFAGLVRRGRDPRPLAKSLAFRAVCRVRSGRQFGGNAASSDLLSPLAQRKHGFVVERLAAPGAAGNCWRDAVVADHRTSVFRQVRFRLDFPAWLSQLPQRLRQAAELLARGEGNREAARQLGVTSARVSQLRKELRQNWQAYLHAERPAARQDARPANAG